jgi:acetyl/propionyl-CoA carboxylase alpha subunit
MSLPDLKTNQPKNSQQKNNQPKDNQMKSIEFEIDGQVVKGFAVLKDGVLWTHANGETWTTETAPRRRGGKKSGSASADPGEIIAPMPGKIIKISAPEGSQVAVGDVVIVMEAMKMEYTLKAQAAGRVTDVRAQAGSQVLLGQVLVKIEVSATLLTDEKK